MYIVRVVYVIGLVWDHLLRLIMATPSEICPRYDLDGDLMRAMFHKSFTSKMICMRVNYIRFCTDGFASTNSTYNIPFKRAL